MPAELQDDANPYEPPLAEIGDRAVDVSEVDVEAERTRRLYIGRETAVKAIGLFDHGIATFIGLFGLTYLISNAFVIMIRHMPLLADGTNPGTLRPLILPFARALVTAIGFALIGRGLRRLRPWARWVMLVVALIGLALTLLLGLAEVYIKQPLSAALCFGHGGFLFGGIAYILVSAKAKRVFSLEYKSVVAKTPYLKYKASAGFKVAAMILVTVILGEVIVALSRRDESFHFLARP